MCDIRAIFACVSAARSYLCFEERLLIRQEPAYFQDTERLQRLHPGKRPQLTWKCRRD